jgi:hypothetical protein
MAIELEAYRGCVRVHRGLEGSAFDGSVFPSHTDLFVLRRLMLKTSRNPFFDALDRAPVAEEDLSPEEVAELERRAADLQSDRVVGIPHATIQRELEQLKLNTR